ncbi:MAG: hypothetical protein ABL997_15590 [Planctomycetota bacterium]
MHRLVALSSLVVSLVAQEALDPRQFLFRDYKTVAFLDMALLRETELWEGFENSVFAAFLGLAEREMGFPFAALDRATVVARPRAKPAPDGSPEQILVLEGNAPLDPAAQLVEDRGYEVRRIGSYPVYVRGEFAQDCLLWPRPEVRVSGEHESLEPLLVGKAQPGLPAPDVLSLLAGKQKWIAYMVGELHATAPGREVLNTFLPKVVWPSGDEPTFLCIKLWTDGDPLDAHLQCDITMRHATNGEGVLATEVAMKELLDRCRKDGRLTMLRATLKKASVVRDGTDVRVPLDLGRVRNASTALAMLLVAGFTTGAPAVLEPMTVPVDTKPAGGDGGD